LSFGQDQAAVAVCFVWVYKQERPKAPCCTRIEECTEPLIVKK